MKSHRNLLIRVSLPVTWALLVLAAGCGRLSNGTIGADIQAAAEPQDDPPAMTSVQREQAYQTAYQAGLGFAAKGQYALALPAFEQALAAKPSSVEALFNLGACHEAIGDPLRAVTIYRRVLEIDPDDADCYANLGTSFIKMYYRDRSPMWRKMARDAWQHSLSLKPNQPRLKEYLAKSESFD